MSFDDWRDAVSKFIPHHYEEQCQKRYNYNEAIYTGLTISLAVGIGLFLLIIILFIIIKNKKLAYIEMDESKPQIEFKTCETNPCCFVSVYGD